MPRFQLEVAIALVVCAGISLLLFVLTNAKEGDIKLPVHANGEESLAKDPFDVTKPEDTIDGYPIDAEKFWIKMRFTKIILALLYAVIVFIAMMSLGWSASLNEGESVAVYALSGTFSLYLLVLSVRSINQDNVPYHSESMIHLSGLNFVAFVLLVTTSILPSTPPPVIKILETLPALRNLWYATLALYAAALVLSMTAPAGPALHFPPTQIYSEKTLASTTNMDPDNVCGMTVASVWGILFFSYTTKVVMLGNNSISLEIGDLPIVPANMRAPVIYAKMKHALRTAKFKIGTWKPKTGSGWQLLYTLAWVNMHAFAAEVALSCVVACLFYSPAFFLQRLVLYLETDPERTDRSWGWVWVIGLFSVNAFMYLITGQVWSLTTTTIQVRLRLQLNSILFAKTLVRKDVASSAAAPAAKTDDGSPKPAEPVEVGQKKDSDDDDAEFSSKAQVMTLMTTDVNRVSEFSTYIFSLVDSPIEIIIGSTFLYKLLGVSCFFGLAVTCLFLPMNHFAGKVVVGAQDNLMKARDERVALMNEILGGIRMLKFMAWERSFEKRVLEIRKKELKYQKLNYLIETLWNAIWNGSPILVTLVSFWHFTVIRQQYLTPSIAFTSIMIFTEMKFALNALPETFLSMLQSFVSLRRIEKYLLGAEVSPVPRLSDQSQIIALQSATITWPQDRSQQSAAPSAAPTPRHKFILQDISLQFPRGELSLICGKLGSGKTLLLLALLGEADLLTGQSMCPRSPPDALANFADEVEVSPEDWIVEGICAYVPQAAWLRNASIKDNILFNLPFDQERYQKTLEVLVSDLKILEDGDESEIGERGVNLSGGQKARVSLARAVYSRASILLLDDALSAVDAHTAHHLYHQCLKGDLMRGQTVILVSHHVQLCAPGASYVVALENGRLEYAGDREGFQNSEVMSTLVQSGATEREAEDEKEEGAIEDLKPPPVDAHDSAAGSESSSTVAAPTPLSDSKVEPKKPARKLMEEEKCAVGRISRDIWETYIRACGNAWYWSIFGGVLVVAALSPVLENGWIKLWSAAQQEGDDRRGPIYYIGVYAAITTAGLIITTLRWFILYSGSIHASTVLYERLLETVLFANIRFHDTVSRGRLLNRFGKDFEGIDSSLSDNFGRSVMYGLSAATTFVTISVVGGLPFVFAAIVLGILYYSDLRRLDSVTRSPLYSIYGETISGVTILRSFGASSKFLRDMLRCADTNANPYYWMWGVNRWLSSRFNLLSAAVVGVTGLVAILTPTISASTAGFALTFASTITGDVRRFVGLEQSMVALERVKEYSELPREPPEFVEPRPPPTWPSEGKIQCENLVIKYAPELPSVLHNISFDILPGEKVGILGRTGSGKSTLALSFFRFVEATEGRILVDGLDIANIGLSDLRTKLTIIPQDPTILSGTLRSTLDVFDEYDFEALRRVHLIPSEGTAEEALNTINANVFRNLDSPVSEGGENFSTGEKQLLCMARAILKRSNVDYATDELISRTIREEFAESTILTIAHRLRTVINYDRVMLLDQGRIVEFDSPGTLIKDSSSQFHALCKATGKGEFAALRELSSSA
ncbi:hypothetical protein PLICRDRAFT_92667 [Plicaturopsis crispa FD-325 SS-3]|nr:hypothetical protein PLICRDRAFT_92667 [Plicaturopsis crispa FD-325 SS-3]